METDLPAAPPQPAPQPASEPEPPPEPETAVPSTSNGSSSAEASGTAALGDEMEKLKVKEAAVEEPVTVDESSIQKAYDQLMAEDPRQGRSVIDGCITNSMHHTIHVTATAKAA
ncbi:hypothetical protein HaLaN_26827 [Haematococcus lacustris]|uniref:Uncharacterized protein n=1 Tax=Haematococcus lacustris TaxID=44745 RepID=A0A6A0A702_HAELA|nr:hypothetical protein HaLaN_26827 [Haematococcus lacustris]